MRCFKMCVLFLIAIIVVTQVAIAQQQYNFESYRKDFKVGYASSDGAVSVQGQVFRPTDRSMYYLAYEEVELTLDGGADFSQTVISGAEGEFVFNDVPVGSYKVFGRDPNTGAFGSVDITLSKGQPSVNAQSNKITSFNTSSLKLLLTDDNLFIMEQPSNAFVTPTDFAEMPMDPASGVPSRGGYGGFGGGMEGMGMMAAGLGVAGLVTGIAALAESNEGGRRGGGGSPDRPQRPTRPVTVGAWSAR